MGIIINELVKHIKVKNKFQEWYINKHSIEELKLLTNKEDIEIMFTFVDFLNSLGYTILIENTNLNIIKTLIEKEDKPAIDWLYDNRYGKHFIIYQDKDNKSHLQTWLKAIIILLRYEQ